MSGHHLYVEIANSQNHTIFLDLLEFIGINSLLRNDNYHSVFAPNNKALESRYDLEQRDSIKMNNPKILESLMLIHFAADNVEVCFSDN